LLQKKKSFYFISLPLRQNRKNFNPKNEFYYWILCVVTPSIETNKKEKRKEERKKKKRKKKKKKKEKRKKKKS